MLARAPFQSTGLSNKRVPEPNRFQSTLYSAVATAQPVARAL